MATQAGHLLVNRQAITLDPGVTTVDTGLRQTSLAFAPDPGLDAAGLSGSRVMVIPEAPLAAWADIVHAEPALGANGTVEVIFGNNGADAVTINVLFWNPDTRVGPVSAEPYAGMVGCEVCDFVDVESDFSNQT